ncbi:hypothetical protein IQ270_09105 [Microcoleus sp. LEGE 07076]|uniref:hypothetical protein n=1 Tax=Microcoleus sp. LEGE 07076 TaxID=915322 RepID=UPI0018810133|nr:hypothetical protein [Microcoleus sp. LEGE 07076]MBE9184864.1 hypothetical protein [Microcoleus sp. LEGE 07076]
MSDEIEKNKILSRQPETIGSFAADSAPAKTPLKNAAIEDDLTVTSEAAEISIETPKTENSLTTNTPIKSPTKNAVIQDIFTANLETETETIPIASEVVAESIDSENYPTKLNQTANPEPKSAQKWQVWAVFISGMLVGSVLSLGSLLAWKMYQERANIQIRLPADVPLPQSPAPVPAAPANRLPGLPPAPGTARPPASAPSPNPTQMPSLAGVQPLASPFPLPSFAPSPSLSPSPAAVETPVTERVNFQAGATGVILRNSLRANISKRYLLDCNSGQSMTVKVQEGDVSAAIIAPNGEKLGTAGSTGEWQGQLASSGDYTIEISGDRQANYGVKIEVN